MTDLHARLLITVSLVTSKGEEQLEQFSSKEQVNKPWLTYAMKYFSAIKKKLGMWLIERFSEHTVNNKEKTKVRSSVYGTKPFV